MKKNIDLIYKEESYQIVGACFEVYNFLGAGFLEGVYQECLEIELRNRNIPFESQKEITINYKGIDLVKKYNADIICYDKVLLELKATSKLTNDHRGQILNYLNATKFQLGLLINFGGFPRLEYERFVLKNE